MKKITILLFFCIVLFAAKSQAQCVNADFSQGIAAPWVGSTGTNSGGNYTGVVAGFNIGTTNSQACNNAQHTLMTSTTMTDDNTGNLLHVVPPGGTSACRLGNSEVNYGAERITYPMTVNSGNAIFTYQYAVVLEDPGHPVSDQPKFNIYVLDSANNQIGGSCGKYEVVSQTGLPGWSDATDVCQGYSEVVHWKDWTAVSIDLSPYMNHSIKIQFTTYDCAQGAHYGYAYIACSCGALQLAQSCSVTDDVLIAPAGFAGYLWTPGGQTTQTDTIHSPVNGATYTCLCTSVTGCNVTLQIVIDIQPVIFSVTPSTITMCPGDSVTLIAHDSTAFPYTYSWTGSLTGDTITVSPTTTTTYTVTATSAMGCSNTTQAVVTINPLVANAGTPATICPGVCTPLDASASTGVAPLSYSWGPPTGLSVTTGVTVQACPTANTTYTVTVTSGDGCTQTSSVAITLTNVTVSATPTNPTICNGASVPLTATGATTYTWSPGTGLNPTTGASVTASPSITTTYIVTGTFSGCTATDSVVVTVVPLPNAQVVSHTDATCGINNGTATASSGAGYTYLWSTTPAQTTITATGLHPFTTYTVTISVGPGCTATASVPIGQIPTVTIAVTNVDSVQCYGYSDGNIYTSTSLGSQPYTYNWNTNPIQYTANATNVPVGTFTVIVTDLYGCKDTATATVPGPPDLNVSIAGYAPVLCHGQSNGTATVSVSGGTPPYTYHWDTGTTTQTANNLDAGLHTVTVIDHNHCSKTDTVQITEPAVINIVLTPDSVKCFGGHDGSVHSVVTGGTPVYGYSWSNGQVGANDVSLPVGTYCLLVTDHNGCKDSLCANVLGPTPINSIVTNADTIMECNGDNNGTITISGQGGTPPLTYHWNTGATGITINNLPGGYHPNGGIYTYTDTITDHNGCVKLHTVHVYEPSALYVHLDSIDVQCKSDCNGQVSSYVTGATPWHNGSNVYYHYHWNTGDSSVALSGLCAGIYNVTVTDSNGCQKAVSATVNVNDIVTATFNANPTTGYVPLPVNFTYTGILDTTMGTHSFTWYFGDGTISTDENPSHTYTTQDTFNVCLVVYSGVCKDSTCQLIYPETPSTMIVPNVFTPNGDGPNDFFQVKYHNIETFNCVIFNRWGKKIYEWSDVSKGWDGKTKGGQECDDGTYFYIINAMGTDKSVWNSHGVVTLLR